MLRFNLINRKLRAAVIGTVSAGIVAGAAFFAIGGGNAGASGALGTGTTDVAQAAMTQDVSLDTDVTTSSTGDAEGIYKAEDFGIDAANYTDDAELAKTVNYLANADADEIALSQAQLLSLEELNIGEDTSGENEILGGGRDYRNQSADTKTAVQMVETPMYVYGIDVSKWQGNIDWNLVKASGVSFAMIKCAGRSTGVDGELYIDSYFTQNIQAAQAAGIQVGVYFFSQATNIVEAYQEACMTVQLCQQYNITYPVAFDWESADDYRVALVPQNQLTMNMIAATFCNTVASYGYTPMVYACKNDLNYTYEPASLSAAYKIWMANYYDDYYYTSRIYMFERPLPTTSFQYQMWQFGVSNVVAGINGYVDMNLGFFYYMPTLTSSLQITATKQITTTYGVPVDLLSYVSATSAAGIDARAYVTYSLVDTAGQLVTSDYAFANVGIYAVNYSLTDVNGQTVTDTALLYVYPPDGV